ncbi:type I 3-dehydroquinate dehydratase [Schaalia sp. 19OD2882]|uniref:type I 3-dehydroquinate dehydratase n=1 Tax=Schaalia sp. 19OD2882 TaxID=2794089 RepID=UPI001C1ED2EA|nr:type I 3-dehydroquinate dehydratase [Schaalia sp. 19OD2882]QWW19009.1 type I 3-dehydroquinate dehydratase [Schaalia sp. 19OD2882]
MADTSTPPTSLGLPVGRCPEGPRGSTDLGRRTRIIIPLTGCDEDALRAEVAALAAHPHDLVEWRVDHFRALEAPPSTRAAGARQCAGRPQVMAALDLLLGAVDVPLLATVRTRDEGGAADLDDAAYHDLVGHLASRADLVDVEIQRPDSAGLIARAKAVGALVVASFHDFTRTPPADTLDALVAQMSAADADILKFAVNCQDAEDLRTVLAAQKRAALNHLRPVIGIGMGAHGAPSRVAGIRAHSAATFATAGAASAPGQLSARETRAALDQAETGLDVGKARA